MWVSEDAEYVPFYGDLKNFLLNVAVYNMIV
jgi:hypothetical protein